MTMAPDRPLDLRNFQDIVDEARRLIPKYCPEWTDHNVSDPGITLIELFAWMTEMTLYQLNRVPEEMYERFLEMVGVERHPPVPAEVAVTFNLSKPLPRPLTVAAETGIATERTEAEDPLVFATVEQLTIAPPTLLSLRAWRQGVGFYDYMPHVSGAAAAEPLFNEQPQEGDAFYIGHAGNLAGYSLQLRLECGGEAAHIDPRDPPLAWEYWSGERGDWAPLLLLDPAGTGARRDPSDEDPTHGLNRPGDIHLHIPVDSMPRAVDDVDATWIRVRYVRREGQGYDRSPTITGIRSQTVGATVRARHARLIEDEVIGRGDGEPDQRFSLRESPVLRQPEPHALESRIGDEVREWTEVADFSQSGEQDRHFVIDYTDGEIRFGPFMRERDGAGRQHGVAPRDGATLAMRSYRSGGGTAGNVGEGAVTQLRSSVPYVASVINHRAASGGLNVESVEEAKLRSLSVLRRTEAAVTREDYERLAAEVPGVGRALCVIDLAPGVVRVVLIPDLPVTAEAIQPEALTPSPALIQNVSAYLDERKMLGTVVEYDAPAYAFVDVDALIYALPGVDAEEVRARAELALRRFLHPVAGGQNGGPELGATVTESQIAGLLQALPGVAYVERVRLRVDDADTSRAEAPQDGLLVLGSCYVLVEATG